MTRHHLRGLYAVTPESMPRGRTLAEAVEAALKGGAALVQYRDKSIDRDGRRRQARTLQQLCRRFGAQLVINDDVGLACELGVGVHLGRGDANVSAARTQLGPDAIIGASCYNEWPRAQIAQDLGADYVAFGSFFPSGTKPNAVRAGLDLIARAKQELDVPVAAIGGITTDNAPILIQAGADMLAVVQGLFDQDDVELTARRFAALFEAPG